MIIYKIQENGKATDFQLANKCPEGWIFIPEDTETGIFYDKIPEDISMYHEQKYIDSEAKTAYIGLRKAAYPDPMEYNDSLVKQQSEDELIRAEGLAQMEKYFSDCLAVKANIPKPEET